LKKKKSFQYMSWQTQQHRSLIIYGITNLPGDDRASDPETPMATATRMATKTAITGSALTAMPQVTCKLTVRNERLPELSW
jgi:hypothetical protein